MIFFVFTSLMNSRTRAGEEDQGRKTRGGGPGEEDQGRKTSGGGPGEEDQRRKTRGVRPAEEDKGRRIRGGRPASDWDQLRRPGPGSDNPPPLVY